MKLIDTDVDRFASSLDLRPDATFTRRAVILRTEETPTPANQARVGLRLLAAAGRRQPLLMYSSWGSLKPDLLVAGLLGLLPRNRRPPVLMVGEAWQPTPGWRRWVERQVVRWADRGIDFYLTTSAGEVPLLSRVWGIPVGKVGSCHVPFDPQDHDLDASDMPRGDVVFAGGDSFRDYPPLLEIARRRPELRFVVATTTLDPASVPPNVEIHPVRIREYAPLMRDAGVVVVPIVAGLSRGVGALTFLMGMWMRKPVVISRSVSSADYIDDGVTGVVVTGSAADYEAAIDWALDPATAPQVAAMGDAAHDYVDRYCTASGYVGAILAELDRLIADRRECFEQPDDVTPSSPIAQ